VPLSLGSLPSKAYYLALGEEIITVRGWRPRQPLKQALSSLPRNTYYLASGEENI
jgi:hypothetical protein